jgi:hypothetical protein
MDQAEYLLFSRQPKLLAKWLVITANHPVTCIWTRPDTIQSAAEAVGPKWLVITANHPVTCMWTRPDTIQSAAEAVGPKWLVITASHPLTCIWTRPDTILSAAEAVGQVAGHHCQSPTDLHMDQAGYYSVGSRSCWPSGGMASTTTGQPLNCTDMRHL